MAKCNAVSSSISVPVVPVPECAWRAPRLSQLGSHVLAVCLHPPASCLHTPDCLWFKKKKKTPRQLKRPKKEREHKTESKNTNKRDSTFTFNLYFSFYTMSYLDTVWQVSIYSFFKMSNDSEAIYNTIKDFQFK